MEERRHTDTLLCTQLKATEVTLQKMETSLENILKYLDREREWRLTHVSEVETSTHSRLDKKISALEKACLNLTWKIFIVGLGGGAVSGGLQKIIEFLK